MNIRKAAWFAAIGNYAILVLQFCTVVIATRLLSKEDIGGFAVAAAIFNILVPFVDFGISRYVVHISEASAFRLGPAAAVSWAVSVFTWAVVWLSAGAIGEFFGRADLAFALRIMSISLCLYPLMVIGVGRLARDLRQDWIASINVGRSAVQAAVSIGLILAGFKLEGLAIGYASGFVFEFFMILALSWRFALLRPHAEGIGDVLRFGSYSAGTAVVSQIGNGTPDIAIGRLLGLAETGIYSRSVALVGLIKRGVDAVMIAVALPGFSRLIRDGADPRPMYVEAIAIATGLTWPFLAWLIVLADPIVGILYGPRWPEVVAITRLAALTNIGIAFVSMSQPFLIAIRREAVLFRIELLTQLIKALLVCFGAQYSLTAAIGGLIAGSLVQLVLLLATLNKIGGISLRDLMASSMRSVPLCIAATMGAMIGVMSGLENQWAILSVGSAGTFIFSLAVLILTDHPLRAELDRMFRRVQRVAS
jgi:O-antigen/teichoic acid export membrane protein